MKTIDTLVERNQDFASHHFSKDVSLMPTLRAMIIGCVDPRVDPALLLGLKLGEAVVIRNVGGRITPETLQTLGMLNRVAQGEGANLGGEFHLIVLHHTQCGIARLEGNPDMLASYFGICKEELRGKAVTDPHAAVAVDVAALKVNPCIGYLSHPFVKMDRLPLQMRSIGSLFSSREAIHTEEEAKNTSSVYANNTQRQRSSPVKQDFCLPFTCSPHRV